MKFNSQRVGKIQVDGEQLFDLPKLPFAENLLKICANICANDWPNPVTNGNI
jgi:hypothetical protein